LKSLANLFYKSENRHLLDPPAINATVQVLEICGYVRSRISIALVRSSSRSLRADRTPTQRFRNPMWESGTGLGLYRM
jgi:hypothetical protein